jgi:hypothetical protein
LSLTVSPEIVALIDKPILLIVDEECRVGASVLSGDYFK